MDEEFDESSYFLPDDLISDVKEPDEKRFDHVRGYRQQGGATEQAYGGRGVGFGVQQHARSASDSSGIGFNGGGGEFFSGGSDEGFFGGQRGYDESYRYGGSRFEAAQTERPKVQKQDSFTSLLNIMKETSSGGHTDVVGGLFTGLRPNAKSYEPKMSPISQKTWDRQQQQQAPALFGAEHDFQQQRKYFNEAEPVRPPNTSSRGSRSGYLSNQFQSARNLVTEAFNNSSLFPQRQPSSDGFKISVDRSVEGSQVDNQPKARTVRGRQLPSAFTPPVQPVVSSPVEVSKNKVKHFPRGGVASTSSPKGRLHQSNRDKQPRERQSPTHKHARKQGTETDSKPKWGRDTGKREPRIVGETSVKVDKPEKAVQKPKEVQAQARKVKKQKDHADSKNLPQTKKQVKSMNVWEVLDFHDERMDDGEEELVPAVDNKGFTPMVQETKKKHGSEEVSVGPNDPPRQAEQIKPTPAPVQPPVVPHAVKEKKTATRRGKRDGGRRSSPLNVPNSKPLPSSTSQDAHGPGHQPKVSGTGKVDTKKATKPTPAKGVTDHLRIFEGQFVPRTATAGRAMLVLICSQVRVMCESLVRAHLKIIGSFVTKDSSRHMLACYTFLELFSPFVTYVLLPSPPWPHICLW
eukprot:CAMPEP_0203778914 /NCGR_PEP_ID=MMETSP0099_2-20121227/8326_1 /ASSEMBLY_ACC=CAM_ASM_000209 /TAXON_ID=96639 /ORGANISM=" , Strain NY0313808BC1" /LENGTH=631 /DNA_ID=CAMNT_0050678605 /DNA_START=216 /DNA_END=2108 /DNA_ORIENTATION=+